MQNGKFVKSSLSFANGNSVEVMDLTAGGVAIRDSKNPDIGPLVFTRDEWTAFIGGVKLGEFDDYGTVQR